MGKQLSEERFHGTDQPVWDQPVFGKVYTDRLNNTFVIYAIRKDRIYVEYEDSGPEALQAEDWRQMAPSLCGPADVWAAAREKMDRRLFCW